MDFAKLIETQRDFYNSGATLPVKVRLEKLKKIEHFIRKNQKEISAALKEDLNKSEYESYLYEIGPVLSELAYMKRCARMLSSKHYKVPAILQFLSVSYKKPTPYGNVLIMSPWNYPFLLTIDPLVDAIAAGNTAIVKPSAYSPATSKIVEKLINEVFEPEYVSVVTGGRKENAALLEQKFDMIFFTGSQAVGKEVLRHAAEHLTPVVLELGGKSPCIVDSSARLRLSAKRIVMGKYMNSGQTCVAPDYVLVEESIKDEFIKEVKRQIIRQFGENPFNNPDYCKMINEKHFDRVAALIDPEKVVHGGQLNKDTMQIAPTVMDNVTWDDAVMQEEIFGPIMPILTYKKTEDVVALLKDKPEPLALYVFSRDNKNINLLTSRCQYGGGCVNETVLHLGTSTMGFGGVGASGMGSYHGKEGFAAFSHSKSILRKATFLDVIVPFQPYKKIFKPLLNIVYRF